MSWLTNFVRPKIRKLVQKTDVPENLWDKCPACGQMIFHRELDANQRVCTHCGHHMRIDVKTRLALMFDEGKYERIDLPKVMIDPLKFKDRKRYADRLKEAQAKSEEQDAIVVAYGTMAGARVIEETIREKLPEGFQRAEYLLEHGIIDLVIARKDLREQIGRVISLLTKRPAAA